MVAGTVPRGTRIPGKPRCYTRDVYTPQIGEWTAISALAADVCEGSADADEFLVHELAGTEASEFAPEAASFHPAEW